MPKKSLSSLELAALTNELQSLINSKISQIYHLEEELLFQLHSKEGKLFLRIIPGKFLNLTKTKEAPLKPSSFCMQLRKYLDGALIKKIEQKETERIILFELEKSEKYFLIAELFAPGNLILTDPQLKIIACLHQQNFKDRFTKPKEKYLFPKSQINWKKLSEKELTSLLAKSEKKNLATSLAIELGLGGLYAEEICKLNQLNKNQLPKETKKEEIKLIINEIRNLLKLIEKPEGFIYEEQISPFALKEEKVIKHTETYNQALDTLNPFQIISPYQKKIASFKKMLEEQQAAIKKQEERIEDYNKKAEKTYEHYLPINQLLTIVRELKKTHSWEEIKKELLKEKKIKKIDLKNKRVLIDL